jgi:hypothetical protein
VPLAIETLVKSSAGTFEASQLGGPERRVKKAARAPVIRVGVERRRVADDVAPGEDPRARTPARVERQEGVPEARQGERIPLADLSDDRAARVDELVGVERRRRDVRAARLRPAVLAVGDRTHRGRAHVEGDDPHRSVRIICRPWRS